MKSTNSRIEKNVHSVKSPVTEFAEAMSNGSESPYVYKSGFSPEYLASLTEEEFQALVDSIGGSKMLAEEQENWKAMLKNPQWGTLEPEPEPDASKMFYGLLGEITRFIAPESEADPVAIFFQLLATFGNYIGHKAYFCVDNVSKHYANLFLNIVGDTSISRKGTSWEYPKYLFERVDICYPAQMVGGMSTGEGLIDHVSDNNPNIKDKRALVIESEFARVLKVMSREKNTLSMVLRQAWDNGNLRVMVKQKPSKATNAHISVIGHITEEEQQKEMGSVDVFNGFANRFLWVGAKRSQLLPQGGKLDLGKLKEYAHKLREILATADKIEQMTRSPEADEYWNLIYAPLSTPRLGMLGAATSRAAPQVVRLSMILALTDGSSVITVSHMEAALALWSHCFETASRLFGYKVSNPQAQKILNKLIEKGDEGMTKTEIYLKVFGNNIHGKDLDIALQELLDHQLAFCEEEPAGKRKAERWFVQKY